MELDAVRPNAGLQAAYSAALKGLVDQMARSVDHWVCAAYRAQPPAMAQDASAAVTLGRAVAKLRARWQRRFATAAKDLAKHYARKAAKRSDHQLQAALRKGGFTVQLRLTPDFREVLQASVKEQVALINSIPQQHMAAVQGAVMRSVQQGRDLATLSAQLRKQVGVTKRRAANIARDQNNKATAALTRVRQQALGIKRARWLHSGAGRHPRPEHLAFAKGNLGGPVYEVEKGAYLEGKWTWPGAEINCRCVSRPIIEALA